MCETLINVEGDKGKEEEYVYVLVMPSGDSVEEEDIANEVKRTDVLQRATTTEKRKQSVTFP